MNRLKALFSGIIAARVITGDRRGGFEHYLAKLVPSFRIGKTNKVRKHSEENASKRRFLQHIKAGHKYSRAAGWWTQGQPCEAWRVPHPHSAKFPPGTKQPLPRKNNLYALNSRFDPWGVIIDDFSHISREVWKDYGKPPAPPIRVVSGIKWRHLNER